MPLWRNPGARAEVGSGEPDRRPLDFHRRLPGYRPTALEELPRLAEELGLERLWCKLETRRLGLPAFKILGASWAVHRLLCHRLGLPLATGRDELARQAAAAGLGLVAATDGNHGRAVARTAAWLGIEARIVLPAGAAPARREAIAGEGAVTEEVAGGYDRAVARAEALAGERLLLVQDTGGVAGADVPRWVAEGYHTLFAEIEEQLERAGAPPTEAVVVPVGVGALAEGAVRWLKRPRHPSPPRLLAVEPVGAACLRAAFDRGGPVSLAATRTIMAGLDCGTASAVAWPWLETGIDAVVTVGDGRAEEVVRRLAAEGIEVGETGAAALAGLAELAAAGSGDLPRSAVVLVTEGVTDPVGFARITGRRPGG